MTAHSCALPWCVRAQDEGDTHLSFPEGIVLMLDENVTVTTEIERSANQVEAVVRIDVDLAADHGHSLRLLTSEAVALGNQLIRAAETVLGDPASLDSDPSVVAPPSVPQLPRPRLAPEGDDAA